MNPRRKTQLWIAAGGVVITLLLAAIFTLGSLRIPIDPRDRSDAVVLYALSTFIVAALLVFSFILGRTLIRLWAERRAEQLGSRFKTKMVLGAMAVSLLPLIFLFFISYALMNRTLNRWFPLPLEIAVSESQSLLDEIHQQEHARLAGLAARVAAAAETAPTEPAAEAARRAVAEGADAAWPLDARGAAPLSSGVLFQRELAGGAELWSTPGGLFLAARAPAGSGFVVVARRLPADFLERYSRVESELAGYRAEQQQIRMFKRQILLTLSLFTVLLLFAATWFALFLSKQITVPIQALAEATREVAAGRLDTRVAVRAQDELGALVRSFNTMTAQLSENRRQIDEFTRNLQNAVRELDHRRQLIETVLENIPTGVVALDGEGRIQRLNSAARQIFGDTAGRASTLADLAGRGAARDIQHLIRRAARIGAASKELVLRRNGRVVHAAVTASPLGPRGAAGCVIVVDDLTELLHAQKAAAWQEVAQRIAHEIKNPLTPIQLSAERLLRYLDRHPAGDGSPELARLVGECAALIAREVGTLAGLVSEFSDFARFPSARLAVADLNAIVRDALGVFQGRLDGIALRATLDPRVPPVRADAELLRRVLVNLIDNAAEAMEGAVVRRLDVSTRYFPERDSVEIAVADTGHGISPEDKDRLFLPHFSTRDRGTGLGLAIASRVVAEHHGLIRAEDNSPVGARFVIDLPVAASAPAALAAES